MNNGWSIEIPLPKTLPEDWVREWQRDADEAAAAGQVFLYHYSGSRQLIAPEKYVEHRIHNYECGSMGFQNLGCYSGRTTKDAERAHWRREADRIQHIIESIS